jgi:hypothetical protein
VKLSERDIEKTCSDFLALDGWRGLKTDPVSDRRRAKGFGEKGMADHLYIRYGDMRYKTDGGVLTPAGMLLCVRAEIMWIEWKAPKGRAAAHQKLWHEAERKRGALTLIAGEDFPATIEGFQSWYRSSGLMRRKV